MKTSLWFPIALFLPLIGAASFSVATANIYTVTSTADTGAGSFRNAITDANNHAGPDTIQFNIPIADAGYSAVAGAWTIRPETTLPTLTDGGTAIDGSSQTGNQGDRNLFGPEIELDGTKTTDAYGLTIRSARSRLKGLVINRFSVGIGILGNVARDNVVVGNYIGTDVTGMMDVGNRLGGIFIRSGPRNNQIGDVTPEGRNIIGGTDTSFNLITGVGITLEDTDSNRVIGNFIGVNRIGNAPIPNKSYGICMYKCRYTVVGGLAPGERNVISGNRGGVIIRMLADGYNVVSGNFIGTDTSGTLNLGNNGNGISLDFGARKNTIGPGNVIAFNVGDGVKTAHDSTRFNHITHNAIYNNIGIGIFNSGGGNRQITPPIIGSVKPAYVSGSAAANSTVEVFSDSADEGAIYEGTATANASGVFVWNGSAHGPRITATCTDDSGNTSEFSSAMVGVDEDKPPRDAPSEFSLNQNYPNPFNPVTIIGYRVPVVSDVRLAVYDVLGRQVSVLVDRREAAGTYETLFDASTLSSGWYLYRLTCSSVSPDQGIGMKTGAYISTRTMLLLR